MLVLTGSSWSPQMRCRSAKAGDASKAATEGSRGDDEDTSKDVMPKTSSVDRFAVFFLKEKVCFGRRTKQL